MRTFTENLGTALAAFVLVAGVMLLASPADAQIVHGSNVSIQGGSLCVGVDCLTTENYGFDTIRLKENNLRIHFNDTSVGSFPTNDWRIIINSTANGGLSYFAVEDSDAGREVFKIEAGADANSLYVDDGGRVGLGTSAPVVELHVVDGDTPTLRLEQNGSSGFTPQTWDLAGNETNFFVRDVTNASKLPFRIRPNAPSNSIYIQNDGSVGMGTSSPEEPLHVRRTDGTAKLFVEEASTTATQRDLMTLENNGRVEFRLTDTASGGDWTFANAVNGTAILITKSGTGVNELRLEDDGDLTITGGLVTGTAGSCTMATPCDLVFHPDFEVESIEEHAAYMWSNSHLQGVGPTVAGEPINITRKTTGILNELEKAHIYIEQLNEALKTKDEVIDELGRRLAAVESVLGAEGVER